jgi:hypothetical protein
VNPGDTYIRAGKHIKADPHLWVIVSDPSNDSQVVAVNFTSQRSDKDQSCVAYPGEHAFIQKESVVLYSEARVVPKSALYSAISAGLLKWQQPVSSPLLAKIRSGACASIKNIPLAAKRMLQSQGILPPDK